MRFKKFGILTAALVVFSTVLCGCSPVKAAWVATRFGTAVKRTPVTQTGGILQAQVTGKTMGLDSQAGLEVRFDAQLDDETGKSYTELNTRVMVLGMDVTQDFQMYNLQEEGKTAFYLHVEQPDLWARAVSSWDFSKLTNLDPTLIMMLAERASASGDLSTGEENGRSFYDMTLEFSVGDLMKTLQTAGVQVPKPLQKVDFSQVTVPVQLRIDGESFLPLKLDLEIRGLSGPVLQGILSAAGQEPKGVELESGTVHLTIDSFGCGEPHIPDLPEGAKENAASMQQIQQLFRDLLK